MYVHVVAAPDISRHDTLVWYAWSLSQPAILLQPMIILIA